MASTVEDDRNKMFGPLKFDDARRYVKDDQQQTNCLLCQDSFNLNLSLDIFIRHLFDAHNLVISDLEDIVNLHEYITYWKKRFDEKTIECIIPTVKVETTNLKYYLLSDLLKEDKQLRHRLRLDNALDVQEIERTDTSYKRQCLFCRLQHEGTRQDYLKHLQSQHNLQLGNCQNLVFIEELVEKIDSMLKQLQCIYCEKTFPDRAILKEHMRKKLHKRINPQNKSYDKFYMVNYLEPDKTWRAIEKEDDHLPIVCGNANSDDEYSDWNDKVDAITCLFCDYNELEINAICDHMIAAHAFDFRHLTQSYNFYQKIKLINYIRRQIYNLRCIYCDVKCETNELLLFHMNEQKHYSLPDCDIFNQPEYYFPTYENDSFLYLIDDFED